VHHCITGCHYWHVDHKIRLVHCLHCAPLYYRLPLLHSFFSDYCDQLPVYLTIVMQLVSIALLALLYTHIHLLPGATTHAVGRLKKPPPITSISGPGPPVPDSQLLCILHHSINPSQAWPSCLSSALRLVQGNFLAWKIILHSHYMSCPS